jgi:glycosyltransferase involved in cell wall biosynthesis
MPASNQAVVEGTSPRKLLFVFDTVFHYHKELFKRLEASLPPLGWELHLLSGSPSASALAAAKSSKKTIANESKYVFYERPVGTYMLRTAKGVLPAVRALRPDAVVCMAELGNLTHWRLALAQRRLGYRLFAWQCGYEHNPGRLKRWTLRQYVPRFAHHLAYHTNAREYALAHGSRPDQISVIHNTINEAGFACIEKSAARALLLQRHPEIGERKIVLSVGRVLKRKRVELILDAMTLMARSDIVLIVVGDGPHLPALRAAAGDRTDVIFAGSVVDGVGPYFDAAEVYVLPGTGGLGINEAMAHSLPVISNYADGSADDLVQDGENGFRLRDGTPQELADRLAAVLDDPKRAARMGEVSRNWITGKFSFDAFIRRIESAVSGK